MDVRTLDLAGLQRLIDALVSRGYQVVGPTVRSGTIVNEPLSRVDQFPVGWADDQEAGRARLRRRDDDRVFGFAHGPQSAKNVFFPTREVLWRVQRTDDNWQTQPQDEPATVAVFGVRSCDLNAVGIHDTVLLSRGHRDSAYEDRRRGAFVVAVACSDPGGTCFCASMGTGPRPTKGFDLCLTEILDEEGHRFVVEVGTDRGAEVLDAVTDSIAADADLEAAAEVTARAVERMGRSMETEGLRDLLYGAAESPRWEAIAERCLACGNCTAVCPTCFCTGVEDVTSLAGDEVVRERVWDSCFDTSFSYLHGGAVRGSTGARYRQWMTHKLAGWQDQFGSSGCVGCGRCITWCPVGIDITEEVAHLRGTTEEERP